MYNVTKAFYVCIHQRILKKMYSTVLNIENNILIQMYLEQHIIMISDDWSNDAENTALITEINYILTHIQTENSYFK